MPSNLYGVANAPILAILQGAAQIACPAGTTTPVISTGPLIAPSQGFYYPAVFWFIDVTFGATLPNPVQFGFRIGAGSNLDTVQFDQAALVASSTIQTSVMMFGPASSVPWVAPGSSLSCVITPTGQAITNNSAAGRAWFALFRAPDQ